METVFHEAVELEGEERRAFLDRACAGDEELRRRVETLLAHDEPEDGTGILDLPGGGRSLLADAVQAEPVPESTPTPRRPERIGRYTIQDTIAEGGMGVVYLAEQDHPRRKVAVKLIRPGVFSEEVLRRFRFEADLLGRLQHPGIAQIHDAGEADTDAGRQPYFALEHVEGVELRRYADDHDLGTDERLELLARICEAVHHAHQKGIVHRDLKPANILVVDETAGTPLPGSARSSSSRAIGQPKVLDFGVSRLVHEQPVDASRLTRTGHVIGTIAYMSPEQARGDRGVDTRSDVYSLGVIGFELLTGHPPHECEDLPLVEALRVVQEKPVPRLETIDRRYRGDVSVILGKALELEPDRRYASAEALAEDIRRHLTDQPIAARPPTLGYQLRRFVRRNKAVVAGAVVAVLGLVIVLVLAVLGQREESRLRALAETSADDAHHSAYAAQMQATAAYHAAGDSLAARQQIALAMPDLRGWEWDYLDATLRDDIRYDPMGIAWRPQSWGCRGETRALFKMNGRALRLCDLESGSWEDHPIPGGSPEDYTASALLPGRKEILWGDVHGHLELLDLEGRRAPRTVQELGECIRFIAVSPDGRFAILCTADISRDPPPATYHRIDLESGRIRPSCAGRPHVFGLDFGADGSTVAVALAGGRVELWDSATLEPLETFHGHAGVVLAVAFSPDGERLVSTGLDETIRVWSTRSGRQERLLGPIRSFAGAVAFHPDGERLVTGHQDATILCWSLETGACLGRTSGGSTTDPRQSTVRHLVFGKKRGIVYALADDGVRVRSLEAPLPDVLRHGHCEFPYAYDVRWSPSERLLATAGWDGTVRLFDAATRRLVAVLDCPVNAHRLCFTGDGSRLVTWSQQGFMNKTIRSWDLATLRCDHELSIKTYVACGEYLSARDAIVTAADDGVWLVHPVTLAVLEKKSLGAQVWGLRLDPTGERIACGLNDGRCVLLDATSLATIRDFPAHAESIRALAFSPDGKRLATAGGVDEVRVWDVETGRQTLRFETPGTHDVLTLRFTRDGKRILVGSRRVSIDVREAESGREVLRLHGHDAYVHALALRRDGRILASASGDNTVRIWDARPLPERIRERDRVLAAESAVRAEVDRLLEEHESLDRILAEIEGNADWGEIEKHAAWCLVHRSGQGR